MTETLQRIDKTKGTKVVLAVVGDKGAIHYWHEESPSPSRFDPDGKYGGVESHYREKPSWALRDTPDYEACWALDGPCWCDGSSLYAIEVFIPAWVRSNESGDMEPFWRLLEREYERRFNEQD